MGGTQKLAYLIAPSPADEDFKAGKMMTETSSQRFDAAPVMQDGHAKNTGLIKIKTQGAGG